jgi:hypothetical protein
MCGWSSHQEAWFSSRESSRVFRASGDEICCCSYLTCLGYCIFEFASNRIFYLFSLLFYIFGPHLDMSALIGDAPRFFLIYVLYSW